MSGKLEMQVGEQSRLKTGCSQRPCPGEQKFFKIAPYLDVPPQQLFERIVIEMSIRVTGKTAPVFLATNVVLVVSAAVLFVELPKGGVINLEKLGDSINLSYRRLAAENHAIVE